MTTTWDISGVGLTGADLPPMADTARATRFDFRTWWDEPRRASPFELEIGSGKGTFLVQQASQQPDVNYLGIEYAHEFWRYAADRCRRNNLSNVRLLHYDAKVFVEWFCHDAVFHQIHIYFPDPWPKAKHHKRRLVQVPFLEQCHRVLQPGGTVRMVTDHDEYFAWMLDHIGQVPQLFEKAPFDRPASAAEGEVVGTNFERKYRREGRPFNALTLHRL